MDLSIGNINIEVIKKNIKNLHLAVYPPDGRVRIAAPEKMKDDVIRVFAVSKISWIKKQQKKLLAQPRQNKREFVSGESHYFKGIRYLLNVEVSNNNSISIRNKKYIDLMVKDISDYEKKEKLMKEWYRKELKKEIPEIIEKWAEITGIEINEYKIKIMKTKWGTCNPKDKRIWLNLELAKKNKRCLEYVVLHEMIHILERTHNEKFQYYMNKYMPNWKEIREELNELVFDESQKTL